MSLELQRRFGPFREIARAIWDNRDRPGYAWNILNDGVCDGCALGTSGMKDWTLDGVHLCWLRLNLLRMNTMPALDPRVLGDLSDHSALPDRSERGLRKLGRIPGPLLRRRGEPGFTPVSWETALELMTGRVRAADPRRLAFYLVSRGTVNETYYAAQKSARALGTSHIDNSARICHSPSTTGLKQTIGFAATTLSYRDLIGSDLVVFIGSNAANNQPVMMKYLHLAKKAGTRVAVVNPFQEPGMDRYWVPSSVDSALRGTQIADHAFPVRVGGDIAFLNGVLKHLIEMDGADIDFIENHTVDWKALTETLKSQSFSMLETRSGTTREQMHDFARLYAGARTAIFVWSMGVTMHRNGVENVTAIANLALARGMVGRPRTGLMPIRGHSGVQGGSEMGCGPNLLPGGVPLSPDHARDLSARWGFPVPEWKGDFIAETVDRAAAGDLEVLYAVGSNLFGVLPDSGYVREAIGKIPLRIHHDVVMNPQMLVDPADAVLVLPATTRYEMVGGNTETSTERRVIFNPEIPGPRILEARDEWRVLQELAARVRPDLRDRITFDSTAAIREEIARIIPAYDGIQNLRGKGDQFQWGGPRLGEGGRFGFDDHRARFVPVSPPAPTVPEGWFHLTTRRGKQFNSMILADRDMTTGTLRDTVILAPADMDRLGLVKGAAVELRSKTGRFQGRAAPGGVRPGTVIMTWPEANALIPRGDVDPVCGIPAYRDTAVQVLAGTPAPGES